MPSRIVASAALIGLLLAACGNDRSAEETSTSSAARDEDRGWIGGEPAWQRGAGAGGADLAAESYAPAADAAEVVGAPGGDAVVPPMPASALTAGSVDDNAAFDEYLAYLARVESLGIALRDFDPTGRIVVSVTGTAGLPVAGADVEVSAAGTPIAHLRTTADGTARFHPALYGAAASTEFQFSSDGAAATGVPGTSVGLVLTGAGGADGPVAVDVLFLLDATGSMGDEIDRLKTSIDSVAAQVAQLQSEPDVRFGMTLYRDLGDQFVTSTFDFTASVTDFREALADVVADGGDDYPEALDEGLAEALRAPSWRDPAGTLQLVFLVADAPPQIGRQVATPYPQSIANAIERGLKIFPVASSESDDQAEAVFRQLAQATGSRFVFLSYGAAGAATGASTDIGPTDYEEMALDQLVVRLITEELAALTGAAVDSPPTDTTADTTADTNPDGQ